MVFNVHEHFGPEPFTPLAHPITKMCGEFDFKGTVWPLEDDLAVNLDVTGTASVEFVADGRYLHLKWSGESEGEPWSGSMLFGHDSSPQKQDKKRSMKDVFFNRYGSFGTGMAEYDGINNVVEFHGQTDECGRGIEKYRTVLTVVDDNSFCLEVHMTGTNGEESQARNLTFTRC